MRHVRIPKDEQKKSLLNFFFKSTNSKKNETGMSDNPKRLKQTHVFDAPPPIAGVVATVYSWTFAPPFDHALKGCSYFGQTKQTFETRTRQHKSDSFRNPKELGLHALWRQYPYDDHWVIQRIETRSFVDPVDAHAWMDVEEARLIEAHEDRLRGCELGFGGTELDERDTIRMDKKNKLLSIPFCVALNYHINLRLSQ